MTLRELLDRPSVSASDVASHLASLDGETRVKEATDLARSQQATLWRLGEKGEPLTAEDFVPAGTPELTPVPFWGQNNQPLFRPFRKVFYRTPDGSLAGYNESSAAPLVGPGYYVLRFDDTGCYVDYTSLPTVAPKGWPPIVSNERGVSQFVYGFMKDYLRRVSGKLLIGRAYRRGKETPHYFVLVRPDLGSSQLSAISFQLGRKGPSRQRGRRRHLRTSPDAASRATAPRAVKRPRPAW